MTTCLHCRRELRTVCVSGIGTIWIHVDGWRACPRTFAAPVFEARK